MNYKCLKNSKIAIIMTWFLALWILVGNSVAYFSGIYFVKYKATISAFKKFPKWNMLNDVTLSFKATERIYQALVSWFDICILYQTWKKIPSAKIQKPQKLLNITFFWRNNSNLFVVQTKHKNYEKTSCVTTYHL